ncbi:MAG: thermonuclease family protein [Alphaproteobacteria bacterium]|nr:thermonuclease family protein [Alphaproteobacteria bacterium]
MVSDWLRLPCCARARASYDPSMSRRWLFALVAVLALVAAALPFADARAGEDLVAGGERIVREAVDGDTVLLADGREVRLVGLQAPKLALGRKNFKDWPLAEDSKRAVAALAVGQRVTLRHGGANRDRHGRVLAHLYRADGLWVQGEMLRLGMARVYTFPDNRARAAEMYALEAEARAAASGCTRFTRCARPKDSKAISILSRSSTGPWSTRSRSRTRYFSTSVPIGGPISPSGSTARRSSSFARPESIR